LKKINGPLRRLAGLAELATWVIAVTAITIVIANLGGLGWLPGTAPNPTCVGTPSLCTAHPTATQRLADVGDQVPAVLFALAALLLLLRFLRTAAKEGPYSTTVPGKLRALGWFVLIGAPANALIVAVADFHLRTSLGQDLPRDEWLAGWETGFPWWAIFAGVTAVTFARILRIGVQMSEDLEGTV
jgi:hypothetical protein